MGPALSAASAFHVVAVVVAAATLAACGGSDTEPSDPFQISCPVNREVNTPDGLPVTVDYAQPTTTGGVGQVTTSCTPASGTRFALGTTTVVCSAIQGLRPPVQCDFRVTVVRTPQLTVTRFLAFGDSITLGSLAPCGSSATTQARALVPFHLRDLDLIRITVGPQFSYPTVLRNLMAARYTLQTPVVGNEGREGETATDLAGSVNDRALNRLILAMQADQPQVVLLQEGVNDINNQIPPAQIANGLRAMVREIRSRGAQPLVGTLLPMRLGACRGNNAARIAPANEFIRVMAVEEGIPVVDLFTGFNGVPGPYIGVDGLHPNEAGYQRMAEIFLGVIRERFEVKF